MEQRQETAVSRKKLPRTLLFLGCAMMWCLFISQRLALHAHDSTDIERLRQTLHEIDQHAQALEKARGKENSGSSLRNGISSNADIERPHHRNSIRTLFDGLSLNNDNGIKPLILKHVIRREAPRLNQTDIVLVTQLSPSKLDNLLVQLKYWNGPASVGVYIKSVEDIDQFFDLIEQNRQFFHHVSFHLVLEKTSVLYYPVNILRHVATEASESHYFLAMDVDLIPLPQDCHNKLVSTLASIEIEDKKKTLFVLPAFSLYPKKNETHASESMLPLSKAEVRKMVKKRQMAQFWKKEGFPQGHGPTRNEVWLKSDNATSGHAYDIFISRKESTLYEPYVLGFKPGIPRYWDEFRGFGYNKISFNHECFLSGYKYAVLNDFYCVHLDHPRGIRGYKKNHTRISGEVWERWHRDVLWPKHGRK